MSIFSNGVIKPTDCIGDHIDEFDEWLTTIEIDNEYMVRISCTENDRYYFYCMNGDSTNTDGELVYEREDRCIEVYFNKEGIIYDIQDIKY